MKKMRISQFFEEEFSKVSESLFKTPMKIQIITEKLQCGKYASIQDWNNDMELIWFNAKNYYSQGSLMFDIIETLQSWYQKRTARLPLKEEDEWLCKYKKIQKRMNKIIKSQPESFK